MEDDGFMMAKQIQYENTYITTPEGYGEVRKLDELHSRYGEISVRLVS